MLNITGAETLSVRRLAAELGAVVGRPPVFAAAGGAEEAEEAPTALLGDAAEMVAALGRPAVGVGQMVGWVGRWVAAGRRSLGKPTKFESRSGRF